jgi:hypothetical protein
MEACLGFPGDVFDLLLQALLSFLEKATNPGPALVGPRCLTDYAAEMSISRLVIFPRRTCLPVVNSLDTVPL